MKSFAEACEWLKAATPTDLREPEFSDKFLSNEKLGEVPFGDRLAQSMANGRRKHVTYVIAAMNAIARGGQDILSAVQDREGHVGMVAAGLVQDATKSGFSDAYLKQLHLCSALYHDIGKSIARDRHPYEGYHLMNDLAAAAKSASDKSEATLFLEWLADGIREYSSVRRNEKEAERLLLSLVRYHDLWGNITTGEASLVSLASALQPTEASHHTHLVYLGSLFLLSLADQFGTIGLGYDYDVKLPEPVPAEAVTRAAQVWHTVTGILQRSEGSVEDARERLMSAAQAEHETVQRVCLLLGASHITVSADEVQRMLQSVCGADFASFCREFGVVRLAYALRFFRKLRDAAVHANRSAQQQAVMVGEVLTRVVRTFRALITKGQDEHRQTTIEMSALTRDKELAEAIVASIVSRDMEALRWIDDEVSAYPCT
ncbi:MAG: hypothetical protein JW940_35690 [Polyangiaceae bacterium]|nr:hypothetical protein [Polyangiaceae bacterium]